MTRCERRGGKGGKIRASRYLILFSTPEISFVKRRAGKKKRKFFTAIVRSPSTENPACLFAVDWKGKKKKKVRLKKVYISMPTSLPTNGTLTLLREIEKKRKGEEEGKEGKKERDLCILPPVALIGWARDFRQLKRGGRGEKKKRLLLPVRVKNGNGVRRSIQ